MSFSLPELGVNELVVILVALVLVAAAGVGVRRHRFIQSLKAGVKFDLKKFALSNQPMSSESDWFSILLGMLYIPFLLFLFAPVFQFSLFMNLIVMTIAFLLIVFGLFGQHMVIADSFSGKTNLLGITRAVAGWDLVFLAKRFVRAIVLPPEKLLEVKEKSVEYSKDNEKLKIEVEEFWKAPKFYPVLVQKYVDSMRDAVIMVTDIPWKEAVMEEPRKIAAGIKTINIAVGALMLSYTPAVEMMSSAEHKKYLKIDKVEVPIFTSIFTNLTAEAQKNISAAALDSMRASDERVRRENAESRANILQERLTAVLKDKNIDRRQRENIRLKGLGEPEPEGKIKVVKKYRHWIALGVLGSLAFLFGVLWLMGMS